MSRSSQTNKKNIPTFICPDDSSSYRRDSFESTKRKFNSFKKEDDKVEDIRSIYESIKEFNVNETKGKSRDKRNQEKLTALGAPPLKNQKVPFKMAMSRLREKKSKLLRTKELLLESGVVAAKSSSQSTQKKNIKKRKLSGHDSVQPNVGLKTQNGVYHVKRI